MKKLIGTGSMGLIGSKVSEYFLQKGCKDFGFENNQRATFFVLSGDNCTNRKCMKKYSDMLTNSSMVWTSATGNGYSISFPCSNWLPSCMLPHGRIMTAPPPSSSVISTATRWALSTCSDPCDATSGKPMRYPYSENLRIVDPIWYYTGLCAMKEHYPKGGQRLEYLRRV